MINKRGLLVFGFLLILVNGVSAQYAQYYGSGFSNFYDLYLKNYLFIDFLIYLAIFMGITQSVFVKDSYYKKSGGSAISIGLSLFLSFSMMRWEVDNNYTLGSFGILGFLVFTILIGMFLYKLIEKMGADKWVAAVWIYIILYALFFGFWDIGSRWFGDGGFGSILTALFWLCLLFGVGGLVKHLSGSGTTPPRTT